MPPIDYLIVRKGTFAEWAAKTPSPVLALGEIGAETDTHRIKIGDGVTDWASLAYTTSTFDLNDVPVQEKRDTAANWAASTDVLLSGQIGYDITNGRSKIGDGASLWPDLPDPGKQFQNVVTIAKSGAVGSADFICSGFTSEKDALQSILNDVPDKTILNFKEGTYNINGIVSQTGKSFTLRGDDNTVFNLSGAGNDIPVLQFYGSLLQSTTISADASVGTMDIVLTDITGVQPGQLIKIFNADIWTTTYNNYIGEMYEVRYVNTGTSTVTLSQGLLRNYLASNTTIIIYNPIHINLENIQFIGTGISDNMWGMSLKYVSNSRIKGCSFSKNGRRSLMLMACYNIDISNCNISGSLFGSEATGHSGYGIGIADASAYINIHDNRIENCRHCITAVTADFKGLNRSIVINCNLLVGGNQDAADVIDSHPCTIDYTITNNKIYPYSRYAFWDGTAYSIFANNYVYGGGGVENRGLVNNCIKIISNNIVTDTTNLQSLYRPSVGSTIKSLSITGNYFTGGLGISLHDEFYKNILISSNNLENCATNGISFTQYTGDSTRCKISNNIISGMNQNGVILKRSAIADTLNIELIGNTIENVGLTGNYHGIYLVDIDDAFVALNAIKGAYTGINEGAVLGAVNNNKIILNKISNYVSKSINKVGSNSKVALNFGYVTENTGTATIAASGTSIVVSHGLAVTPTRVIVTPTSSTEGIAYYVPEALKTATTFTLTMLSAPTANVSFDWSVVG